MGIPYNDQWVLHRMQPRRPRRAFDVEAVMRAGHEPQTHEPPATHEAPAAGHVSPEAVHESPAAGRNPAAPRGRALGKRPSWIDRDT